MVERLNTADAVAAAKWVAAGERGAEPAIDDPVREAEVYDAMAGLGHDRALPENWVRQVFFGQIEANKDGAARADGPVALRPGGGAGRAIRSRFGASGHRPGERRNPRSARPAPGRTDRAGLRATVGAQRLRRVRHRPRRRTVPGGAGAGRRVALPGVGGRRARETARFGKMCPTPLPDICWICAETHSGQKRPDGRIIFTACHAAVGNLSPLRSPS
ncbi:hypothetical protein [Nocardia beijingensis]|uniref:hypothetical protein n=1 Tax=Nocardia beijingensis TaxID=95162 RepID=UPI003F4CD65F